MCSPNYKKSEEKRLKNLVSEILKRNIKEDNLLRCLDKIILEERAHNSKHLKDEKVESCLETYRYKSKKKSEKENKREEHSLLHLALCMDRYKLASKLVETVPNLSGMPKNDDQFNGLTPFHIAIAKQKYELVKEMMQKDKEEKHNDLFRKKAVGYALKGTVMIGEFPLSIAVLNCDNKMFKILIDEGADPLMTDSNQNNLLHITVNYTFYFPEKNVNAETSHFSRAIAVLLNGLGIGKMKELMYMTNNSLHTPMQLACKKGLKELFIHFLNMDKVNRFSPSLAGVADTYHYDITDLDTVFWRRQLKKEEYRQKSPEKKIKGNVVEEDDCSWISGPYRKWRRIHKFSALQIISDLPIRVGSEFMSIDIIEEIIDRKWEKYRPWVIGLGLSHFVVMLLLTIETCFKSKDLNFENMSFGYPLNHLQQPYFSVAVISIPLGLFYFLQEIFRRVIYRQNWFKHGFHHNTMSRFFLLLFGITLIVDSIWNFAQSNNYMRYFALAFGWFGIFIFLRCWKPFCYHTVVFLEILTGDILKFLPVMIITLIPFTAAAFEMSKNTGKEFLDYRHGLLTLFQWMNGFGELDNLQDEPKSGLAVTVFVLFVIFANIILLQTLIALMSNNHIKDVDIGSLFLLQKLSIVVFLESFIFIPKTAVEADDDDGDGRFLYKAQRADEEDTVAKTLSNFRNLLSLNLHQVGNETFHFSNDTPKTGNIGTLQIN